VPFDPAAYRVGYLEVRARQKLASMPDDLLERYAITLPASDAEIVQSIKAVRAAWADQLAGSRASKFAKRCQGADDELRAKHRDAMLTASWWTAQAKRQDDAAQEVVKGLTALLKDSHGKLGVLTRSYLAGCAATLGLSTQQAEAAATRSGLRIVDGDELPEASPLGRGQRNTLEESLALAGVPTVVHLVHPGVSEFSLLNGFSAIGVSDAHLDGEAVGNRALEAERMAMTPANDARREALGILKTFSARGDLRALALFDLAEFARRCAGLGPMGVRQQLTSVGLHADDAAAIAVIVGDHGAASSAAGPRQVVELLAAGRLRDATRAASELSDQLDRKAELLAAVAAARARYDALIFDAMALSAARDEVAAAGKVRDAAAISVDEAEEVLAVIPLPPVVSPLAGADAGVVLLSWQPNVGHPEGTAFVVRRGDGVAPQTLLEGSSVSTPRAPEAADSHAPAGRTLFYSIFATAQGRPASRAATATITLLPKPTGLRAEVGQNSVSVRWSSHPDAVRVIATRRFPDGRLQPVAVAGNTLELTGLAEGEPVTIEVVAEFRAPDGKTLRSPSVAVTAAPRSRTLPLEKFEAKPSLSGGDVNLTLTWTQSDNSEVRVRRSDAPAPWPFGSWVSPDDLTSFGDELLGQVDRRGSQVTVRTNVARGRVHHLTPFSIGGTGIVVGRATTVGVSSPVRDLRVTLFSGFAKLTWLWPDGSTSAEISWWCDTDDHDGDGTVQLKRSEYDRAGGFDFPLRAATTRITVSARMVVDGKPFSSPPAEIDVAVDTAVEVRYDVTSSARLGPLGGRTKELVFSAARSVTAAKITVVASPGPVMPMSPGSGVVLAELRLNLTGGAPAPVRIAVPKSIARPYWLRCFAGDERIQLLDPRISDLKEN
jgi:hypothetical protein